MGKETNPTEESGVSNDHLLGYKDGGNGKLNSIPQVAQEFLTGLVLFLVIFIQTTPSIFWETVMNGLLVVRDFCEGPQESRGGIKRVGFQFCHRLKSL